MNASTTGPKPRKRHRSANGTRRPYQDGKQWIAPKTFVLPDGSRATIRTTGPTREQTLARLRQGDVPGGGGFSALSVALPTS